MVRSRIALVASALVIAFAALPGCAAKNSSSSSDGSIGTSEDLLTADDSATQNPDDSSEAEEEVTSGGADPTATSQGVDPSVSEAQHLGDIKLNAGRFFTPAGCVATTIAGNVVTHVFTNCTGPGGRTWNGTVVATWTRPSATSAQVVRVAKGFKIGEPDGDTATVDRTVTVTYSKDAGIFKRVRAVDMSGTMDGNNGKIKDFSRQANWTVTWDPAAKCVTRDGSSVTKIGGGTREHSTAIEGYKRCGIGNFGCPDSGKITLTRSKGKGSDKDVSLVIVFEGGQKFSIQLPDGRKFPRALICKPPAKVN